MKQKDARLVLAALLVAGSSISAGATIGHVHFRMLCGLADVKAVDYRVDGNVKAGRFSFRSPDGDAEWLSLDVSATVNGRALPRLVPTDMRANGLMADAHTLVYTNAEARAELTFEATRAILRLTVRRAAPQAIGEIVVGTGSRSDAGRLFDPSVRFTPYHVFSAAEPCVIQPGLASPPPWILSYRRECRAGWWSAALEPDPARIDFSSFAHVPSGDGRLAWAVRYPKVDPASGDFVAPPLVFRFGDRDPLAALARHVADLRADGKMRVPERNLPAWHGDTLACTWRNQKGPDRRTQADEANTEAFVKMLEDHGIDFGTLIIDDFWGDRHGLWEADPKKWPDLRGFIDRQHAKGRHVLLWICTDGDGLPEDERIGNLWNPESPAFLARLRESARRMLSSGPGCYDADGVKFDFTSDMPNDYRGRRQRHVGCGFVLERFRVLSEALLAVKPQAVLDYQCTNPYFTHTLTMLRLNDYFGVPGHGLAEMRLRARIAGICAPGAVIDTDHVSFREFPYAGGYDFFRQCREFGVESLYLNEDDLKDPELLSILQKERKANR